MVLQYNLSRMTPKPSVHCVILMLQLLITSLPLVYLLFSSHWAIRRSIYSNINFVFQCLSDNKYRFHHTYTESCKFTQCNVNYFPLDFFLSIRPYIGGWDCVLRPNGRMPFLMYWTLSMNRGGWSSSDPCTGKYWMVLTERVLNRL